MSVYTTELRYICETLAGLDESAGGDHIEEIIAAARPLLFNFDYPIFDAAYRETLETKILRRYYTREIGFETVALFKHFLHMRLDEIMPYYNKLYESELIQFNPMLDTDLQHTGDKASAEETEQAGQTTGNTTDKTTGGESNETVTESRDRKSGSRDTGEQETSDRSGSETRDGERNSTGQESRAESENETHGEQTSSNGTESKDTAESAASNKTAENTDLYSDTPQGALTGLETDGYLTNARKVSTSETLGTDSTSAEQASRTGQEESQGERSVDTSSVTDQSSRENTTEISEHGDTENKQRIQAENYADAGSAESQTVNAKTFDTSNTGSRSETTAGRSSSSAMENYIDRTFGKSASSGTYSKMLQEFRETFLNIDTMILDNLNDLFMGVW